jgi:hypothetical protein
LAGKRRRVKEEEEERKKSEKRDHDDDRPVVFLFLLSSLLPFRKRTNLPGLQQAGGGTGLERSRRADGRKTPTAGERARRWPNVTVGLPREGALLLLLLFQG